MATQVLEPAQYCSGPYKVVAYPEAASQSFKQGQFVYLSSGALTVCASDATEIHGMALADASGTTGTMIPVVLAQKGTFFRMNVYHGTIGSAISAWAGIGVHYGLVVSSNRCYVDVSDTTNDALKYLDVIDTVGDTYGKVEATVIDAVSSCIDVEPS